MNALQGGSVGDISLDAIAVMAQAQNETGNNANVYYHTNPFSDSGIYKDDNGVTWAWTHEGDWCNRKGNNCPNGKWDLYKSKKI